MAQGLEKPGAVTGEVIVSTLAGSIGTAGGDEFIIKANRIKFNGKTVVAETTADGDDTPHFEHNLMLYGDLAIFGWMVAAQALGFANLISTVNNIATGTVVINLGATRNIGSTTAFHVVWSSINVDWSRTSPYVGVAIQGNVTDTAAAAFES